MKREQVQKSKAARREDPISAPDDRTQKSGALASDLSDILDEIDDVLESNAEAFVAGFVQKNGE